MVAAAPSMKIQSETVLALAAVGTQAVLPTTAPAYWQAAMNSSFLVQVSAVALSMFLLMPPSTPIVVAVAIVRAELVWFKTHLSSPVVGTVDVVEAVIVETTFEAVSANGVTMATATAVAPVIAVAVSS